eukprot:2194292-Rhodomonas_salina.1
MAGADAGSGLPGQRRAEHGQAAWRPGRVLPGLPLCGAATAHAAVKCRAALRKPRSASYASSAPHIMMA